MIIYAFKLQYNIHHNFINQHLINLDNLGHRPIIHVTNQFE
jgi:hypothetical protein